MTLKIGDVITVSSFVHDKGKLYRIIGLHLDEPAVAHITPLGECLARPNCPYALLADCVLVASREPPRQSIRSKPEVEQPSILRKFARATDEKDTLPREYRQEEY